jgi:hypothetical protein
VSDFWNITQSNRPTSVPEESIASFIKTKKSAKEGVFVRVYVLVFVYVREIERFAGLSLMGGIMVVA